MLYGFGTTKSCWPAQLERPQLLGGEWLISLDGTGTVGQHKYIPHSSSPPRSLARTTYLLRPPPHFGKGQHKRAELLKAVELFKRLSKNFIDLLDTVKQTVLQFKRVGPA